MLNITFNPNNHRVQLYMSEDTAHWPAICSSIEEITEEVYVSSSNSLSMPVWAFLRAREGLGYVLEKYGIAVNLDDKIADILKIAAETDEIIRYPSKIPVQDSNTVLNSLKGLGLQRELKSYQLNNISKLIALPAAATFSVPGSGKTTEALAYYIFKKTNDSKLLVVCPKNAFAVWEEQVQLCLKNPPKVTRLIGGESNIKGLLQQNLEVMLITYQQLAVSSVFDAIAEYIYVHPTFLFLDESHRIKKGASGAWASAVLKLSHLPKAKLIMTGTPMPNNTTDLISQFNFLYPGVIADEHSVVNLIKPIFVRTPKSQLGLPPLERHLTKIYMRPRQRYLYELMRSEEFRLLSNLQSRDSMRLRKFGRSIMRLLQMTSNPALLLREDVDYPAELYQVLEEGDSPKIEYACRKARELSQRGEKVLIWSNFVQNVEIIASRLSDIGADFIHGGVDTGSDEDDDTRERKIARFHQDPAAFVLVANPAACSESISLHTKCHYAIYVDRNYNAAQYLQSEDRIHRIGLQSDTITNIEILYCPDTIDESVKSRLENKVGRMAKVLDDESLNIEAVETDVDADGTDEDDINDLLKHLSQKAS